MPVEFERFSAGEHGVDEADGGVDQIGTLLLKDGKAIEVPGAMGGGGRGTLGLLAGVKELEREDGEPVEHHAGCLGVEFRVCCLRQVAEEPFVDLFDEVVALLVEGIDGPFDAGNPGVRRQWIAGFVLFVPKGEVRAVLAADQIVERCLKGSMGGCGREVPGVGPQNLRRSELPHVRRIRCAGHVSNCTSQHAVRHSRVTMSFDPPPMVRTVEEPKVRRVLIYRLGSLGDTLIALPALHLVARAFPNAERAMLTNHPVNVKAPPAAAILEHTGLVHRYLRYTVGTRSVVELARLWREIVRFRPEVLVYMAAGRGVASARRDAAFFRVCGIRRQIGVPLTETMDQPQREESVGLTQIGVPGFVMPTIPYTLEPEARRLTRNLAELGDAALESSAAWELHLTPAERATAEAMLEVAQGRPILAVSVGTKVQAKDWGRENWRELLTRLGRELPEYALALAGVESESEASEYAAARWGDGSAGPVINLCGRLTPRESAAAFERAQLFLGHDSGPMHLAAAVQTPCVAIFAARNIPRVWFPYGDRHRVLYHRTECWGCNLETCLLEHKRCLTGISVEEVLAAVKGVTRRDFAAPGPVTALCLSGRLSFRRKLG